jgi:hypothetical protein
MRFFPHDVNLTQQKKSGMGDAERLITLRLGLGNLPFFFG